MSELLTAEERSALREPYADAGGGTRLVTPVVFPSVDQLDPERVAALSGALRRWLDLVAEDLSVQLRLNCAARPPGHQFIARSLLPSAEEEPFWAAVEGLPGSDLLLTVPRSFAAAISERIFGAPFEVRSDRPLARAEIALLRDLAQRWLDLSREVWHGLKMRVSPPAEEEVDAPDLGDPTWLRFNSDLLCGGVSGGLSISLAPFTARVLLGEASAATGDIPTPISLASQLGDVPIELCAVLGQAAFTLDELSSLRVGDVIALDRSAQDPVDIVIHDRAFFRARAGVAGQWVAIELIGEPKEEKRYEY